MINAKGEGKVTLFNNGWLVQETNCKMLKTSSFVYNGVNAYDSYPLMHVNDIECKKLSNEQAMKPLGNNENQMLEFISDKDLLQRYVRMCINKNIQIRILFIQSDYTNEMCDEVPCDNFKFLGYEYCCIPIDDQIITDLDWCQKLQNFHSKLNENGLFDSYKEADNFKKTYISLFHKGDIGDGDFDGFIMKVWEIADKGTVLPSPFQKR